MFSLFNNINVFMVFWITLIVFPFLIPLAHAAGDALAAGWRRLLAREVAVRVPAAVPAASAA